MPQWFVRHVGPVSPSFLASFHLEKKEMFSIKNPDHHLRGTNPRAEKSCMSCDADRHFSSNGKPAKPTTTTLPLFPQSQDQKPTKQATENPPWVAIILQILLHFYARSLTVCTAHEDQSLESKNPEDNRAPKHPGYTINSDFISPQLPSASNLSYSDAGSSSLTASPTQNTEATDPAKWKRIPSDRLLKVEWILEEGGG